MQQLACNMTPLLVIGFCLMTLRMMAIIAVQPRLFSRAANTSSPPCHSTAHGNAAERSGATTISVIRTLGDGELLENAVPITALGDATRFQKPEAGARAPNADTEAGSNDSPGMVRPRTDEQPPEERPRAARRQNATSRPGNPTMSMHLTLVVALLGYSNIAYADRHLF